MLKSRKVVAKSKTQTTPKINPTTTKKIIHTKKTKPITKPTAHHQSSSSSSSSTPTPSHTTHINSTITTPKSTRSIHTVPKTTSTQTTTTTTTTTATASRKQSTVTPLIPPSSAPIYLSRRFNRAQSRQQTQYQHNPEIERTISLMVEDIKTHCDDLAKENPTNSDEIEKIKNYLISNTIPQENFEFNYFIVPTLLNTKNFNDLCVFSSLRNIRRYPFIAKLALNGIETLHQKIDIDSIQTYADGATLQELYPLIHTGPMPTSSTDFTTLLNAILSSQHNLITQKDLTRRSLRSIYRMRSAIGKGNTIDFWRGVMDVLVQVPDFPTGIRRFHDYILSHSIPITSPAHVDYQEEDEEAEDSGVNSPDNETVKTKKGEEEKNGQGENSGDETATTTKEITDEADVAPSTATSPTNNTPEGETTPTDESTTSKPEGTTSTEEDQKKSSITKKIKPSPFPYTVDTTKLKTQLKIPKSFEKITNISGTLFHEHLVELAGQLNNKKPSIDPEELTKQFNDLLEHYEKVIIYRSNKDKFTNLAKKEKKHPLDFVHKPSWPQNIIDSVHIPIVKTNKGKDSGNEGNEKEREEEGENEKTSNENKEEEKNTEETTAVTNTQSGTTSTTDTPTNKPHTNTDTTTTTTRSIQSLNAERFHSHLIPEYQTLIANHHDQTKNKSHSHPFYDPIYQDQHLNGKETLISDLSIPLVKVNHQETNGKSKKTLFSSTRVWGHRPNQQDHHLIAPNLLNGDLGLFGVFDGAGSEYVSQWLTSALVDRMSKMDEWNDLLKLSPRQKQNRLIVQPLLNTMIMKLYPMLDGELMEWSKEIYKSKANQPGQLVGGESYALICSSTCVIGLHHRPSATLNISHVGDSLALLSVDPGKQKKKKSMKNNNNAQKKQEKSEKETMVETIVEHMKEEHAAAAEVAAEGEGGDNQTNTTSSQTESGSGSESEEESLLEPSTPPYGNYIPYIVTKEHKPDQPEEIVRVHNANASVRYVGPDRIPYLQGNSGTLNMSRALGGFSLKTKGLINTPNVININLPRHGNGVNREDVNASSDDETDEANSNISKPDDSIVDDAELGATVVKKSDTTDEDQSKKIEEKAEKNEQTDEKSTSTTPSESKPLSTRQLLKKYNTPAHLELYQEYKTLGDIVKMNHFPPIRHAPNVTFDVKSLTLGSDGLYEALSDKDMIDIPLHRLYVMNYAQQLAEEEAAKVHTNDQPEQDVKKSEEKSENDNNGEKKSEKENNNEDNATKVQKLTPVPPTPIANVLHDFLNRPERSPCYQDPFHRLQNHMPPIQLGFDAKWHGSPSDALVGEVLGHYKSDTNPSDNITGIVAFF